MTILEHLSMNKPYVNQVIRGAPCTPSIFVTCLQTYIQIPGIPSPSHSWVAPWADLPTCTLSCLADPTYPLHGTPAAWHPCLPFPPDLGGQ